MKIKKQVSTITLFLFLGVAVSWAQDSKLVDDIPEKKMSEKKLQEAQASADSLFAHVAFMESAKQYEDVEYADHLDLASKAKLAESYRCNADYEKAEYWYRQYVGDNSDAETCVNFAKVLQANDKCEEASKWYKRYLTYNPVDAEDIEILVDCDNLKSIQFNEEVLFYNMEELNTTASEYSMVELDNKLLFTSTRKSNKVAKHEDLWTNGEFSDLFVANLDNFGSFSRPARIKGKVNQRFHDGVAVFDKNEYRLYFTRNERKAKNDKVRELKLYTAKITEDGTWYDVEKMSINAPGFSSCHPAVSSDGKVLVFSSNRPGGKGGMDLYYSIKEKDAWSKPQIMSADINSVGNEIFPHLSTSGELFFASNGHVGLGGLDVFRAKLDLPKLSSTQAYEVQNIGRPFNSLKDDFAFVTTKDGHNGYLASNREGGKGKDDIYRWILDSDDPLVLDFYKKSMCMDNIFKKSDIENATISMLEFTSIAGYKEEDVSSKLLSGLDDNTMGIVVNILKLKNTHLVRKQTFSASDPEFEFVRMRPNRDYLFIAEKDGFFPSHKFVTSRENEVDYMNCIEMSLEPYRLLAGRVEIENDPDVRGPTYIDLYNHCTKEIEKIPVSMDGSFEEKLKCNCTYDISIDDRAYEYYKERIEAFDADCEGVVEELSIKLKYVDPFAGKLKEGDLITLNDIFYEYDEYALSEKAKLELDHLINSMRQHPSMKVQLTAHTDSRGRDEYNLELSEKRAWSAAQYVIEAGIGVSRISYEGMGEQQLINQCGNESNCSEEQHEANRRTEVRITSL